MPGLSVLVGCFLLQSSVPGQPTYDKFRFEKIAVIDTALSFRGIFSKTENEAWLSLHECFERSKDRLASGIGWPSCQSLGSGPQSF